MSYKLVDVLRKCGYRDDLDCSDISVLNLEIDLHPHVKDKLVAMRVNVCDSMKDAKDNDPLKYHSLYTSGMTKEYLKNAKVSLFPNDPFGWGEWLSQPYQIVGLSVSAFNLIDESQKKMSQKSYMMASAGNSGENGLYNTDKWFDLVGACDENKVIRSYSSYGNGTVDYVGIDGFEYMNELQYGSSFSRPMQAILVGQLMQLHYNRYKFHMTPLHVHNFIKAHCVDIDEEGYDIKTGSGLFHLPAGRVKFYNVDIPQEILDSIRVVGNGTKIYVEDKIDLTESSNYNASLLAYAVRRKMSDYRLSHEDIVLNLDSMDNDRFMEYIKYPSMLIRKLERGE